uniref:Arf-GAP domain-containing protein n=1 Tax=Phytophthora ramorum TaxID=164328 RepID=H3HCE2_PHYRM
MMFSRASHSPVVQLQSFRKLTEMMHASAENQSCADCTSRLSDSIWASTTVGAFLCIHCAGAHRKLGVQLSRVKSLHLDTWTDEEVAAMKGGNKSVNEMYSKYLDKWLQVDASLELLPNTATDVREKCIRAKYEDRQFTKLPHAFGSSEEKNQDSPENPEEPTSSTASGGLAKTSSSPSQGSPTDRNQQRASGQKLQSAEPAVVKPGSVIEVTKRFLNYFVVVGRGELIRDQNIEKTKSPTAIRFLPAVLDMFPDTYGDAPLPAHIADFAFPEGFMLSKSYVAPEFFSFVLTNNELPLVDAPVPFLVGTHSDCLKHVAGRTTNVVFVDLDHNRVIPAVDESGKSISVPKIPDREGSKLRAKLVEVASIFDPYAAGISRVDLAFPNEEHLEPIGNFASDHGQTIPLLTSYSESSMSDSLSPHYSIGKIKRGRRGGLTDSRYNETDNFSTEGARKAFLRFFVTLLKKYASYLMFDRFIEDRVFSQQLPEVLFFDQSINQKLNRSLTIGKKKYDCSFLEDRSDEIQE